MAAGRVPSAAAGLVSRLSSAADRLVSVVAPGLALQRETARRRLALLASGYSRHGASTTKKSLLGWVTGSGGPDVDIVENIAELRERSRDLFQGTPLARGALLTFRTNEIGQGLTLNAQVDADVLGLSDDQALAWEDQVEREWALWAGTRDCDAARRCTFGELQALARLSQLMSGDVFVLLPVIPRAGSRYDLRVQLIEADCINNPLTGWAGVDILGGVEVGPHGEPVAYHIQQVHPGDMITVSSVRKSLMWVRVPAFGETTGLPLVLHLMELERPGQRRGVPLLSPVIESLKQLGRYSDAELMAAVVSGMFTAAITSETPQNPLGPVIPTEEQVDSADTNSYELGNGALLSLAPGESLASVNPARPNAGFDPFVKAVCRQIGAALELPYELLMKQFEASYSASRAALLEAWKRFKVGRAFMAANFCQPIYEQWLAEAVARGRISAPGFFADAAIRAAWCGAEWHGPAQGQLDPTKEVEAAEKRVQSGFSTRARETAELTGGNWERLHRVRVREERLRREGGLAAGGVELEQASPDGAGDQGGADGDGDVSNSNRISIPLTPSDNAAIVSVDEGRASLGLAAAGGEVGGRWIAEHSAQLKAELAPEIAEVAEAERGKAPSDQDADVDESEPDPGDEAEQDDEQLDDADPPESAEQDEP